MQQLQIESISIEDIQLNANGLTNSRSSVGDISSLQKSIEDNGLLDPLVVWKTTEGDHVLVAGYRRYAAITALRATVHADAFSTLNVSIFTGSLEEALARNIEENVQRKDLNPADECVAVFNLYSRVGDQTDVAKLLGMSQPWVSQRVNLYRGIIPRGLEYLRAGTINLKEARNVSRFLNQDGTPNEDIQNEILDKFDEGGDIPAAPRAKTFRNKQEFQELALAVATAADEGEISNVHQALLERVISWHRCEISLEALLFDEPELGDDEIALDSEIVTIPEATPSVRRRVNPVPASA